MSVVLRREFPALIHDLINLFCSKSTRGLQSRLDEIRAFLHCSSTPEVLYGAMRSMQSHKQYVAQFWLKYRQNRPPGLTGRTVNGRAYRAHEAFFEIQQVRKQLDPMFCINHENELGASLSKRFGALNVEKRNVEQPRSDSKQLKDTPRHERKAGNLQENTVDPIILPAWLDKALANDWSREMWHLQSSVDKLASTRYQYCKDTLLTSQ
jgi:hypothetical protein